MTSLAVFALLVLAGGAGAFAGSVPGNAFGHTALFAGAAFNNRRDRDARIVAWFRR